MLMLTRRLQVLIDEDRYGRIESEARRRGVPVAVIVREAIDRSYPGEEQRRAAIDRILAAEPMPVPETVEELKREIEEAHVGKFDDVA
jgi:hypothetical protein